MRFEIDEDNRILVQRLERVVRDDECPTHISWREITASTREPLRRVSSRGPLPETPG